MLHVGSVVNCTVQNHGQLNTMELNVVVAVTLSHHPVKYKLRLATMFNHGFYCTNCGPIEKAKERSINKVRHKTCNECGSIVTSWERPLNERVGRCANCAHGSFTLALGKGKLKGQLLRKCKHCGQVSNPDTNEILREGNKEHEYKPTKAR